MDVRLKEAMLEEEEELREMHSRLSRNPLRTFPNPDHLRMTAAELDVGANIQSARGEYLGVINRKARYVGGNSGGRLQQRISGTAAREAFFRVVGGDVRGAASRPRPM